MKRKQYLSTGIYLINKKFKKDQFYHYFEEPNNVIVIPKIGTKYIIVEQKREPINKRNFEFPMGWIDKGEKPLIAAKRELDEETGYKALKNPNKFLEFYADPGRGNRKCYCYFIDMLDKYKEPENGIRIFFKNKKQIFRMIKNKKFNNASHIAAFNYYINNF
jgi:8-oxo-dGTP pyrophosphatase MutT (NUDIX family)